MIFHPSERTLSRYGDGDLAGLRARRVAAHLEGCTACRTVVASNRALGEAARRAAAPALRAGVWERIAERREGGERVILPAETVGAATRSIRWAAAAAAAVVVIAVAVMALPVTRGALAGEPSRLTFVPALPRPGATVTVEYAPTAALADAPRLLLRAHYVTGRPFGMHNPNASGRVRGAVVATLARRSDGRFTATVMIPDPVAYAIFAVSDTSGEIVDSDHRRSWVMGLAGANGRPDFNSLISIAWAPGPPRTDERARAAADSLVAIYPDSAQSWAVQVQVQGSSRIPHWLSVFDSRERKFAQLEKSLARRDTISAGEMTAMATLAAAIEDSAAASRWQSRLIAAYPLDPRAIEARFWRAVQLPRDSALARLPALDTAWILSPEARPAIAELGLGAAMNSGDSVAIRAWAVRALAVEPELYGYLIQQLLSDPAIRASIVVTLRARLRELADDSQSERSLISTRSRDRLYRQALEASALGVLSQAMVLDGRYAAANDTLGVAIRLSEGFCGFGYLRRYRAGIELTLGDTAAAVRDLVIGAAAKGSRTGPFGDSAAILLGHRYEPAQWNALMDSAAIVAKTCSRDWATP